MPRIHEQPFSPEQWGKLRQRDRFTWLECRPVLTGIASSAAVAAVGKSLRPEAIEDVLTENVFPKMWEIVGQFETQGEFIARLVVVAKYRALDKRRSSKTKKETPNSPTGLDEAFEPDQENSYESRERAEMREAELTELVDELMSTLPAEDQIILDEEYYAGLSGAEMAQAHGWGTDLKKGTKQASVRVERVENKLRRLIGRDPKIKERLQQADFPRPALRDPKLKPSKFRAIQKLLGFSHEHD